MFSKLGLFLEALSKAVTPSTTRFRPLSIPPNIGTYYWFVGSLAVLMKLTGVPSFNEVVSATISKPAHTTSISFIHEVKTRGAFSLLIVASTYLLNRWQ